MSYMFAKHHNISMFIVVASSLAAGMYRRMITLPTPGTPWAGEHRGGFTRGGS